MTDKTTTDENNNDDDQNYDYRDIDDLIHGRVRLALMAYLSGAGSADFTDLKKKIGVSDGNLSIHIQKLEKADYIDVEKRFKGRRPQTICSLTHKGRDAWIEYISHLQSIIGD